MEQLNTKDVLLESLQFPLYVRPDFLRRKQQESGWGKEVYFTSLELHTNNFTFLLRGSKPQTLRKLTNGKVLEAETFSYEKRKVLDHDILDTLHFSIQKAKQLTAPAPIYSNLHIISFLEVAIDFIKNEFELQAGIKRDEWREFHTGYPTIKNDGTNVYVINHYSIQTPTPFFDFLLFKNTIRDLLLNSTNDKKLKAILQPCVDKCKQIVELWNKNIHPLEQRKDEQVRREHRLLTFHPDSLDYTFWPPNSYREFVHNPNTGYSNLDFARLASKIGTFITNEVITEKDTESELSVDEPKWEASTYLLYYYHIAESQGRELSKSIVQHIADKHKIKAGRVRNKFIDLTKQSFEPVIDQRTFEFNSTSKTKFRTDYELILPVLKKNGYELAHKNVSAKLNILINSHKATKK